LRGGRRLDRMTYALQFVVTALVTLASAVPQDSEYIRALERAQTFRPSTLSSTARIAAENEPGTPLIIRGRLYAEDGKSSIGDAIVFAYHTDRTGLYDKAGAPAHSWRIRGWAKTSADGSFEFRTIRPGRYPGNTIPAHVHFTVFAGQTRYHAGELRFEDDDLVPAREREASRQEGVFGSVRPVRTEGNTDIVDVAIRLRASERF
jgi:protocatechuate 3,4-dioxygenase beta subunit